MKAESSSKTHGFLFPAEMLGKRRTKQAAFQGVGCYVQAKPFSQSTSPAQGLRGASIAPGKQAGPCGGVQGRLFPDPLTPSQIAFKRAHRIGRAIAKYGPVEGRPRRFFDAIQEGLRG